jgi:thiamine-phosphate pyrophosphorylase
VSFCILGGVLLYYITGRSQFPGDEASRRVRLLEKIAEAARAGVNYVQLRERDLAARQLESLACEIAALIRQNAPLAAGDSNLRTRLLINSRIDVALACGADGIHLRSDDVSPKTAGEIWSQARRSTRGDELQTPLIAVSCHTIGHVAAAVAEGANLAVFAPVFEKKDAPRVSAAGIEALREACRYKIPVLALGGVTVDNARSCMAVGAAGIAGIRLFQENDVGDVVRKLRA